MNDDHLDWEQKITNAKATELSVNTTRLDTTIAESGLDLLNTKPEVDPSLLDEDAMDTDELEETPTEEEPDITEATAVSSTPSTPRSKFDISKYFRGCFGDPEELHNRLMRGEISEEQLLEGLRDQNSRVNLLKDILDSWSDNAKLMRETIARRTEAGDELISSTDKFATKYSKGKKLNTPKVVSGDEAVTMAIARLRRTAKVNLYNSGFWLVIKCPDNLELHDIMQSVYTDVKAFGRILGNHFFFLSDFYIIKKFCEILPSLVVNSNLVGWRQPTTLLSHIHDEDYDNILNVVCSLLYRDGVDFDLHCTKDDCKFKETVHIDIAELRKLNISKLPEAALARVFSNEPFTEADSVAYAKLIDLNKVIRVGDIMDVHVKSPTLLHRMTLSAGLFAYMTKFMGDPSNVAYTSKVREQLILNYYRMYLPWIAQIDMLKYNDNNELVLDFSYTEPKAILEALDSSIWEEHPEATEQLKDAICDFKLTFFAYAGKPCPICGNTIENLATEWVPVDMHQFFFALCYHRLSGMVDI